MTKPIPVSGPDSFARAMGVMPGTAPGPQPQSMAPVTAALSGLINPVDPAAQLADHAARLDGHDAVLADHASQLAALADDGDRDSWDDASDHADQLSLPITPATGSDRAVSHAKVRQQ
jgi:hypothetical protein